MNSYQKNCNILVGVDVQRDFIDGSLAVPEALETIPNLQHLATAVRRIGGLAVWTRDWHPSRTPHFDTWPVHCVQHTAGAEFYPDLVNPVADRILSKGQDQTDGYSGWEATGAGDETLESIIHPCDKYCDQVNVFLGGLATDYCVKATTLDIANHFRDEPRVHTHIVTDAMRGVERQPGDSAAAIAAMIDAGASALTTAEALELITNGENA